VKAFIGGGLNFCFWLKSRKVVCINLLFSVETTTENVRKIKPYERTLQENYFV